MKKRVLVLGAGFGGLELSTMLSEAFGDGVDVTLIDKSDSFVFGFSKLDVMFGRTTLDAVRLPYKKFVKPGVRFLQETIASIDPVAKRVTTDRRTHEADFLVVALGADYDLVINRVIVFHLSPADVSERPRTRNRAVRIHSLAGSCNTSVNAGNEAGLYNRS